MTTDLPSALAGRGHRVTGPRQAVWQALVDAGGHLTVEQVAERVRAIDAGVNRASVYRALGLFRELGLARESRLAGEEASRWEVAHPDEHFHVVCDQCGRIDHHVGSLVEEVRRHLRDGHGFEPRHVELTVHGRCSACASTAP